MNDIGQAKEDSAATGMSALAPVALIDEVVEPIIRDARAALLAEQREDGHFLFELEADATIPAEYILLQHFIGEIDETQQKPIATYLRGIQGTHGGWPLFHDGDFNISASVKAYYALKLAGDDPDAPHMARARGAILAHGGAARANVFTRITLALFGQVPWRAVPVMPIEVMILPKWFFFHMSKVAYWSRTVIAPLLILMDRKPEAANPGKVDICELFTVPSEDERGYMINATGTRLGDLFILLDKVLQVADPYFPKGPRRRAEKAALDFIHKHLNGEDGLGGIFPAMANAVMAFHILGYPPDHPDMVTAKESVRRLLTFEDTPVGEAPNAGTPLPYCQPCLSPIWDTSLATHALLEAGDCDGAVAKANQWMVDRQILDVEGDWAIQRPGLRPGGWAFQYRNDHYPDVDDTAVVALALHRASEPSQAESLSRAIEWIIGMQSKNGGWGAFDADNTHYILNSIPFADHGALLDPPTADVSARCLSMLAQTGHGRDHQAVRRTLAYLKDEQEADGSWFGRWGSNYVYGTWSVLCALNAIGEDMAQPYIRKAVDWLKTRQRADGGWGEDGASYWEETRDACKDSTPSQTAWALLGLMAAGEVESPEVRRGIEYLARHPREGAKWDESLFNAVGFPRIFYITYDGYSRYFPLWALARYRNLMRGNTRKVAYGM
ncbi:MAG: squalene--hopene cyclase [Proteobacteria bacterium]|nr:squalene--hopene cyclase [Pseudomonadota bacterium]